VKELIFHRLLVPAAERHAARTAFVDVASGRRVTFGDHLERVARLGSGLGRELGVKPGDRVAVLAMNGLSYVELWHAALLGAAVINPLNLRFSEEELAFVLADSGSRVCFVDATFAERVDPGQGRDREGGALRRGRRTPRPLPRRRRGRRRGRPADGTG
jgi:long-chain acyl-CoA synthetase